MNQTNIEHSFIAVFITSFFGVLGYVLIGAALSIGIFIGREHAQREYKIGDPSKLYGYEALDLWNWSLDAKLDLAFPVISSIITAVMFY